LRNAALRGDAACQPARLNLGLVEAELSWSAKASANNGGLECGSTRDSAPLEVRSQDCLAVGSNSAAAPDFRLPTVIRVAVLSFLFNWPSTGGGNVHTAGLVEFRGRDGFELRHFYARFPAWSLGRVTDAALQASEGIEFSERDWNLETIRQRFRAAVDSFGPDYVVISDAWNMKPHLFEAMRGHPTILLMQAQECLCALNNLRLLGLGPAKAEQWPKNQLATPQVCHQCLGQRGQHSGALHQVERALAGVGTAEYDGLMRRAFFEAEAVLVLNPITAAMLEPFAKRVCIVPWGIDPARFPWPAGGEEAERVAIHVSSSGKADEDDSEPQPGRHHEARGADPGNPADNATPAPNSEPRQGDITHLAAGSDVAPMGLDGKEESDATLPFPGFAPSPRVYTSPGVCTPGFRISPFQGSDTPCPSGGDGTPVTKPIVTLFMAAVAGEVITGFHVAHEACRTLREARSDFELVVTFDPPGPIDEFTRSIGWRSQSELPGHYRAADICLVPTIAQDALSITSVEAMAVGRPVVASRIGGLPYTVSDGLTGLLFEPGNPWDLAEKIARLLDDAALRRQMGLAGRRRFEEDFMWPDVVKRYWRPLLGECVRR
jgi:glycosyltransferase involved in cell wall biosynthesis